MLNHWSVRKLFWTAFLAEIAAIAFFLGNQWFLAGLMIVIAVPFGVVFWIRKFRATTS